MKRIVLFTFFALIVGGWFASCSSDKIQDDIIEVLQNEIPDNPKDGDVVKDNPQDGDENTDVPQDGDENTEEPQDNDESAEEPQDGDVVTEELNGAITYPKFGKYGLNILADDFVEATQTGDKLVEYSLSADLSAGNSSLKIVFRSLCETEDGRVIEWGGFYQNSLDNWLATSWDNDLRGNTFTVYESGKLAHATVTLVSDCIIEYYENGATTPTKVKEIKVSPEVITEEPQEEIPEGLNGVITYPKVGKYGLNILADGFVEATQIGDKLVKYSLSADLSAGNSHLKIVIRTIKEDEAPNIRFIWGGFEAATPEDNWLTTRYDTIMRGNTFTVYESGKRADLRVTFESDCMIEYYENGATTPTKVKTIKVTPDVITEEPKEDIPEGLDGVITYPKNGKYGLNILADGFTEAKKTEWGRFEYSVRAELAAGKSHLKIIVKSAKPVTYVCDNYASFPPCRAGFKEWHEICPVCGGVNTLKEVFHEAAGFNQGTEENWVITNVGSRFTCTVFDSRKPADVSVIFAGDCIIEFYENGSKTPTKTKQIKVIQ